MMGAVPIGEWRVEAPFCEWPEMDMGVVMVDGEVCGEMDDGCEAKQGRQALPARAGVFWCGDEEGCAEKGEIEGD